MIKFGTILGLSLAFLMSASGIAITQEARFEDEVKRAQQQSRDNFPALMEESVGALYNVEQKIRGFDEDINVKNVETLLEKLNKFTFRQDLDDLDDDQKETLKLAKDVLRDVKTLLDHQLSTLDTVKSVGSAKPMTINNLIQRRAVIESQLATIRLKGLHYSHPAHGLNVAIKAGYDAMAYVAGYLEDNSKPLTFGAYEAFADELDDGLRAARFALARWRFRAEDKPSKETENLVQLADRYEESLRVEEDVLILLEDEDRLENLGEVLSDLLELEQRRLKARDARLAVFDDEK